VLITGGNRGLGFGAAEKLAQLGFRVVLTSRSGARAQEAAAQIRGRVAGGEVRGLALDLSSLTAVHSFAKRFAAEESALHVLIANAFANPRSKKPQYTVDGHETTFAVNHLGHFLLVTKLLPLLEAGAEEAEGARVVVVSSGLHSPGTIGPEVDFDLDDLDMRKRAYNRKVAYKNSKLANLLFAYELDRRMQGRGIRTNALCPGFVPETGLEKAKGLRRLLFRYVYHRLPFAKSLDEAVETYVYVATDPSLKGVGGKFYAEKREIPSSPESYDLEKAARLWQASEEMIAD
jgi:NAD(P)-dependent dehydrogenase (short-subunit alcohol dehydrogenase family)